MNILNKIKCKLGLHSYKNISFIRYEDGKDYDYKYIIGFYMFKCKCCNKKIVKQFSFPYGEGTTVNTKNQAIINAKNFKSIR